MEEKIAQLGNHQEREVQERKSLGLELEGVRAAAVGSTTMCTGLVHELANLRVSVETECTTQAVASAPREVACLHDLRVEARREREIEWAAVKSEFAAAEAVKLDAVRAATEGTPQEVVCTGSTHRPRDGKTRQRYGRCEV